MPGGVAGAQPTMAAPYADYLLPDVTFTSYPSANTLALGPKCLAAHTLTHADKPSLTRWVFFDLHSNMTMRKAVKMSRRSL